MPIHSTSRDILVHDKISLTTTVLNSRSPWWKVKFVSTLHDDWLSANWNRINASLSLVRRTHGRRVKRWWRVALLPCPRWNRRDSGDYVFHAPRVALCLRVWFPRRGRWSCASWRGSLASWRWWRSNTPNLRWWWGIHSLSIAWVSLSKCCNTRSR